MTNTAALELQGDVIIALDACVCNPFKRNSRDRAGQAKITKLIDALCDQLKVIKVISTAQAIGSYRSDAEVLDFLENEAFENQAVVVLVTRDYGFADDASWHPDQSMVCIYLLPRKFFGRRVDQYTRVIMIQIITTDFSHLFLHGHLLFAEYLYVPNPTARAA